MPSSYKPAVIERIFDLLYNENSNSLSRTVVYADDIYEAKRYCNEVLGANIKVAVNPYNFMKDIVRGRGAGNMWPQSVRERGWTGQQRTGDGAVFEFIPITEEEADHLALDFKPTDQTVSFSVQSLSLPIASKQLGRVDESWLLQVCVDLRIIETHLAVGANRQIDFGEVTHLQMDIKLRKVQIDALFLGITANGRDPTRVLITLEAKQQNQRILPEQISRQVIAAFKTTDVDVIIPLAVAALRREGVYVAEFEAVKRDTLGDEYTPKFHRDAIYRLEPPVKGISFS